MTTWFAYWRNDPTHYRWVLYGFPQPDQDPPVLGWVSRELDDHPEARAILAQKIEREHGVRILITSEPAA